MTTQHDDTEGTASPPGGDPARALVELARDRNSLTTSLVDLAVARNESAARRTAAAEKRTELAFIALGIALMRYFGLSPWTVLDGGLVLFGILATVVGLKGYAVTRRFERQYATRLHDFLTMSAEL